MLRLYKDLEYTTKMLATVIHIEKKDNYETNEANTDRTYRAYL
jgi:uncharacterized protein (UPF0335 family)